MYNLEIIKIIKQQVRISNVIGSYVKLSPGNNGNFSGLCPFHKEKTPSFTVTDHKGFYHCFGCQEHGSVIDFLMKFNNLTLPQTIENLAGYLSVDIEEYKLEKRPKDDRIELLYKIQEYACQWYQGILHSERGKIARQYLHNRKLSNDVITQYRLGYAPHSYDALASFLLSRDKRISTKVLEDSGLIRVKNGRKYDLFRNRIIFPILSQSNKVIAFGGRSLDSNTQPKYLNSPETAIFKKNMTLYQSHSLRQKNSINNQQLLVAEGYFDVISLDNAGFKYSASPLGTATNISHLNALWKINNSPYICFDGDLAGQKATERIARLSLTELKNNNSLKIAQLPANKDPDDIIQTTNGRYRLQQIIDKADILCEFLWKKTTMNIANITPEIINGIRNNLMNEIQVIPDVYLRNYYKNYYNKQLFNLQFAKNKKNSVSIPATNREFTSNKSVTEQCILYLFIKFHNVLNWEDILDKINYMNLEPQNQEILNKVNDIMYSESKNFLFEIKQVMSSLELCILNEHKQRLQDRMLELDPDSELLLEKKMQYLFHKHQLINLENEKININLQIKNNFATISPLALIKKRNILENHIATIRCSLSKIVEELSN